MDDARGMILKTVLWPPHQCAHVYRLALMHMYIHIVEHTHTHTSETHISR